MKQSTVFGHQTQPVGHIGIVHQMVPTVEVVRLAFVELFALPAQQKPLVHLEAAEQLLYVLLCSWAGLLVMAALLELLEVVSLMFLLVLGLLAVLLVLQVLTGLPSLGLVNLQVFAIVALFVVPVLWLVEVAAESVIDLLFYQWLQLSALRQQDC